MCKPSWRLAVLCASLCLPLLHGQETRPDNQPASRPAGGALQGTLVVIAADGARDELPSGKLTLTAWARLGDSPAGSSEIGEEVVVDVVLGRWTLDLTTRTVPVTSVSGERFATGTRGGLFLPDTRHPIDRPVALEARVPPQFRLLVHDRATGKAVGDVDVVSGSDWRTDQYVHPGADFESRLIVRRAQSPVVLPPPRRRSDKLKLWVRAPGHAWQRVEVDVRAGGERPVALGPGGDIAVSVRGEFPARDCVLRLYPEQGEGTPLAEFQLRVGRQTVLRDLPVGSYSARLEQGDWFSHPVVLAQDTVEIVSGKETALALEANAKALVPGKVDLSVTVVLPEAWGDAKDLGLSLTIEAIGAVQAWEKARPRFVMAEWRKGDKAGEFHIAAPGLFAGSYQLRLDPLEVRARVDLEAGTPGAARIEVPLPQEVRVLIVDAVTGKPLPGAALTWHGELPHGVTGWGASHVAPAAGSDVVKLTVPRGVIYLSGHADGYEGFHEQQCVVGDQPAKVKLELRRQAGVHVVLMDGPARVPNAGFDRITLEPLAGQAAPSSFGDDKVFVRQGGRYQLRVVAPDGYEAIPEREVLVKDGEVLRVEIKLERQK